MDSLQSESLNGSISVYLSYKLMSSILLGTRNRKKKCCLLCLHHVA